MKGNAEFSLRKEQLIEALEEVMDFDSNIINFSTQCKVVFKDGKHMDAEVKIAGNHIDKKNHIIDVVGAISNTQFRSDVKKSNLSKRYQEIIEDAISAGGTVLTQAKIGFYAYNTRIVEITHKGKMINTFMNID